MAPGALTAELAGRLGPSAVAAVDPSESFVAAARERIPGVDVRQATGGELPFADGTFDRALAQLVVHFMADPVAGLRGDAARHAGGRPRRGLRLGSRRRNGPAEPVLGRGPRARPGVARRVRPGRLAEGDLTRLFAAAGLREVEEVALSVEVEHPTFEEWWEPFTLGVGPAGAYAAGLDPENAARLRERVSRPAAGASLPAHGAGMVGARVAVIGGDPASSHRSWFGRSRDHVEVDGVDVFIGARDAVLAFPRPDADLAAAVDLALEAQVREVSCWALAPDDDLGGRLHTLGFQDGWAPHWMGIDPRDAAPPPDSVVEETTECADTVPYASGEHRRVLGGDVRHFVVRDEGIIVGHAVLDVDGETARNLRHGRRAPGPAARTCAGADPRGARRRARGGLHRRDAQRDRRGEPVYRGVGFESLGWGMTWWLFPGRHRQIRE